MFASSRDRRELLRFSCALAWLGLVVSLGCAPGEADLHWVRRNVRASAVFARELTVARGQTLEVEIRPVGADGRPVAHLWDLRSQRELARAQASWRESGLRLSHANESDEERRVLLLVYGQSRAAAGPVDVLVNGRLLVASAFAGGALLQLRAQEAERVHAVSPPGGARDVQLHGFDAQGRLLGSASGRQGLLVVQPQASRVARVLVSSGEGPSGAGLVNLYANDGQDRDGDGLGTQLERALGTCDSADDAHCRSSLLARYYRSRSQATRDSDRDGIDDGDELLGAERGAGLDLPRWGADPLHKDVFVEVDYAERASSARLTPSDLRAVSHWLGAGTARELRNPSGRPGLRLHVDVGFEPEQARDVGLYGDFGGSATVAETHYKEARKRHFRSERRGYFRYAFGTSGGTGQASGDAFTFNVDQHRARYFAHELGHTLGLRHHGHDEFGRGNCKPHYQSLMNYVYQNSGSVGFSRRALGFLNPAHVLEAGAARGLSARSLREPPFELEILGDGIDWNRDGLISSAPVRAPLTWATYKSCGAAAEGRTVLWEGEPQATTPSLVCTGEELHVLWVDTEGRVGYRLGRPQAEGCKASDGLRLTCRGFAVLHGLASLPALHQLTALALHERALLIAASEPNGRIRLVRVQAPWESPHVTSSPLPVPQDARDAPAISELRLAPSRHGASAGLLVVVRAADPEGQPARLFQALAPSAEGPWVVREMRSDRDEPLHASHAPSLVTLPSGELCGAFPDAESFIRFHCYVPERDQWQEHTALVFEAGLGPKTQGPVSLAFLPYRNADGSLVDAARIRGALHLTFTTHHSTREPRNPERLLSEWLDRDSVVARDLRLRYRGAFLDQWTNLVPHTAVSLLGGLQAISLEAVMATRAEKGGTTKIEYLPHADGIYDAQLGAGNDFEVMERGVCLGIRPESACGTRATAAF